MIGLAAGWLWILLMKLKVKFTPALAVTGFVGAMVNTVSVMGSIYLLLAVQYAQVKSVGIDAVWGLVMATVVASGIPEAIVAAVLVAVLGKVLLKLVSKRFHDGF